MWVLSLRVSDATTKQKMMGIFLMSYTSSTEGTATVSYERIAEQTGMGLSTVKRQIRSLVDSGWLSITKGRRSVHLHNIYHFEIPDLGPTTGTWDALEGKKKSAVSAMDSRELGPTTGTISLKSSTGSIEELPDIVEF